MFRSFLRAALTAALVAAPSGLPSASAQFYGGGSGCSSCGATPSYSPPVYSASNCAPVSTVTSCTPVQPVYSTCYQRVPVTTYKKEKQTVEVPYYKTEYEDREVTTMVPVSRKRTVEVPTVSYKTVQENRVINRDMGRWVTNYQPIAKCNACQVDPRPGMIGWLNRTGYSFRSAFTPNYRTSRQYVPKMMACNVASTRQVAVPGTKKVVVNETHMVAKKSTERVAVRKLAYRKETVTVARPVTAYRTVPIGSALAYGGYGGSLAYGGIGSGLVFADDDEDSQTALKPEEDDGFNDSRTASPFPEDRPTRSSDARNSKRSFPAQGSSFSKELKPVQPRAKQPAFPTDGKDPFGTLDDHDTRRPAPRRSIPQQRLNERPIVLSGWKASRRSDSQTASTDRRAESGLVQN